MSNQSGEVRLKADSEEDLAVLSAMIQDATIRVGDIAWLKSKRRFAVVLNRYRWEEDAPQGNKKPERVRAALRFENVLAATFKNVPVGDKDHILGLLAVSARTDDDGGGMLDLDFSGFASIRLEVECIEAYLEDMTRPWRALARPDHDVPGQDTDPATHGPGPGKDEPFEEG